MGDVGEIWQRVLMFGSLRESTMAQLVDGLLVGWTDGGREKGMAGWLDV